MLLNRVFSAFLFLLSILFFIASFDLPFFNNSQLGGGFFPRSLSVIMMILVGFHIIKLMANKKKSQKKRANNKIIINQIILILLLLITLALTNQIGMLLSIGLFILLFLITIVKSHWIKSIILTVAFIGFIYIVFVYWLGISLPKGALFN